MRRESNRATLEKESKLEGITLPNLSTYCKATLKKKKKRGLYQCLIEQISQRNKIEWLQIDTTISVDFLLSCKCNLVE